MVTIKDIAAQLGIAPSTVSKGLNGANDISEELRQQVLDTAIAMGYKTKKMKNKTAKSLCLFIENMEYELPEHFGYDIIIGFKQMALRENWSITIKPFNPYLQSKEKYDNYMLRHGYRGAFLVGFALQDDWMQQLEHTTIPTVLLDNYIPQNPKVNYVGTDSQEGIQLAVDHLKLLGHTKIAFLNGSPNSMITVNREMAFRSAMENANLPLEENLIQYGYYVSDCAKYHVPDFLSAGATAIICGSDLIALGVITECKSRGFEIPKDISIIGFDDITLAETSDPPLTTVRQNRIALGKCAFYCLSNTFHDVAISKTLLRPTLKIRNTTAKCNKHQKSNSNK